jgi:protein phosphatase
MLELLPLAAIIENKFLCVNGGIGEIGGLIDIKNVVRPVKVKESKIAMELLWADVPKNDPILL